MVAKHTSEPWTFDRPWINSAEGGPICTINDSNPNRDADARLIVAAPETAVQRDEMLAVLEAVESTLDCGEDGTGWYFIGASLAKEVSDAIAKAKGEAQGG